jgi:hypothetical protein
VCEEHDSPHLFSGNGKITIQRDARAWYANRPFDHLLLAAHVTSLAPGRECQTTDQPGPKTRLVLERERLWKMITGVRRVIVSAASGVAAGGEA